VLGRIDAEAFKTGGMQLDVDAAAQAVQQLIAEPLSLERNHAAAGILDVATSNMAGAIRLSLFEKGADPEDFALAPFGGAAGLHACAVADELGIRRIVFPANASTLSALGILQADLRYDLSESLLMPAAEESVAALAAAVDKLRQQAQDLLRSNGFDGEQQRVEFSVDMRYRGQAFELATPWPEMINANQSVGAPQLLQLVGHFHSLHEERFAHASPEDATEIVTVRAVGIGVLGQSDLNAQLPPELVGSDDKQRTRRIYLDTAETDVPCVSRNNLRAGDAPVTGPLVVEESYTALLLTDGWQARVIDNGDLLCEKGGSNL
jgi:N-methylhydantoinase A